MQRPLSVITQSSPLIFEGQVTGISSEVQGKYVYTWVEFPEPGPEARASCVSWESASGYQTGGTNPATHAANHARRGLRCDASPRVAFWLRSS